MTELHKNIRILYEFYNLPTPEFSSIIPGETSLGLWTSHVNEIRNAIDYLSPSHEDWIAFTVNKPRADVIEQLRNVLTVIAKPSAIIGVSKIGAMVIYSDANAENPILDTDNLDNLILE